MIEVLTGFLVAAKAGIGRTMELYPGGWRWADNMERARMLLPLAWLVRVEDTPEHRRWLQTVAADLVKHQHAPGFRRRLSREARGKEHRQTRKPAEGDDL